MNKACTFLKKYWPKLRPSTRIFYKQKTNNIMTTTPRYCTHIGHRCWDPKCNQTHHHQHMHLVHTQFGLRTMLQFAMLFQRWNWSYQSPHITSVALNLLQHDEGNNALGTVVMSLLHVNLSPHMHSVHSFNTYELNNDYIHDITPDEALGSL